jgi:hypothetical protein
MASSVTSVRGLNKGNRRYKNRCYEQPRVASNGMGCEWTHNYFRDEWTSRLDPPDSSRRTEADGHEETPEAHRTGVDFWGRAGLRDGQGACLFIGAFEVSAIRDNDWHRKRSEDCINPPDDDEDWIDD